MLTTFPSLRTYLSFLADLSMGSSSGCWRLVCRVCLRLLGPCCRGRTCICTGRSKTCICTSSTRSGRSRSKSLQCYECLAIIAKPPFLVCGPLRKHRFKHAFVSCCKQFSNSILQILELLTLHRENAVSNNSSTVPVCLNSVSPSQTSHP